MLSAIETASQDVPFKPRNAENATPAMAQYIELKHVNPHHLLFYRMGDFFELFFEDAEIASQSLGIALTKRGKHEGEDIPMCGVPVHAADDYMQKLIALGFKVAVCEQLEDPQEAKKRGAKAVVKRGVVRLVTAGTLTEESLLDPGKNSFLLAICLSLWLPLKIIAKTKISIMRLHGWIFQQGFFTAAKWKQCI